MELSYSLLFYLKKPKNYTSGNIPVYMRFTVDGIPKECATTRTADPEKWCSKTNREDGRTETTKFLNAHLDDLQQKVHNAHAAMVKEEKPITASSLRDKFLGRDIPQKVPQLLEIFRLHNNLANIYTFIIRQMAFRLVLAGLFDVRATASTMFNTSLG